MGKHTLQLQIRQSRNSQSLLQTLRRWQQTNPPHASVQHQLSQSRPANRLRGCRQQLSLSQRINRQNKLLSHSQLQNRQFRRTKTQQHNRCSYTSPTQSQRLVQRCHSQTTGSLRQQTLRHLHRTVPVSVSLHHRHNRQSLWQQAFNIRKIFSQCCQINLNPGRPRQHFQSIIHTLSLLLSRHQL